MHYARGPILVIAEIAFFVMGWSWFCRRFPAIFMFGFMRGLLGGGRRRRW
jgi:hypothetical protein